MHSGVDLKRQAATLLFRYLDAQVFRYTHRNGMKDVDRIPAVMNQVAGKHLLHTELTGKVGLTSLN